MTSALIKIRYSVDCSLGFICDLPFLNQLHNIANVPDSLAPVGVLGTTPNLIVSEKYRRQKDAHDANYGTPRKPVNRDMRGYLELVQKVVDWEHQNQPDGEL